MSAKVSHADKGRGKEKADKIREYNMQASLQNHVDAVVNRNRSPEWREMKREDRRRDLQMGRGAAMASRDVAQRALPSTQRGRKATDTAVDRAMHSASWREKEQQKGAKEPGPPVGPSRKLDAAIEAARRSSGWREKEAERNTRRKEKLPDL